MLLAKSSISINHINDKVAKGAKYIELHTIALDFNHGKKSICKNLELIKESKAIIKAVHLPMDIGYDFVDIINCTNFNKVDDVFNFANQLGEHFKSDIIIIMHMGMALSSIERMGVKYDIYRKIGILLDKYSNIKLGLENSQNYIIRNNIVSSGEDFNLSIESIPDEINDFFEKYNGFQHLKSRVGLVLDTCHALSCIRLTQLLEDYGFPKCNLSLRKYFESFSKDLFLIHLANCIDLGNGDNNHAQPFISKEDELLLVEILDEIKRIDYNGCITIEVNENNYLDSTNFRDTLDKVKNLL